MNGVFSVYGGRIGDSTVVTLWNKYPKAHPFANDWNMEGRPKSLNQAVKENRLGSAREFKNDLELPVSRETVNRKLLSLGYKSYKAPAKPALERDHMLERYRFADNHQSWGMTRWSRVIFTDESAFRFINPNGRIFVRRLEEEQFEPFATQPCVPFSDMVMVWGAISTDGVALLVRAEGTLDGDEYLNLFRYRLWKYYPWLYNGSQIFQDDNASSHTADIVNEWFGIRRMDWPSRSPHLNIIEDVSNGMK